MDWRRWMRRADDDVADLDYPTDARPIPEHPRHVAVDPEGERRAKLRRRSIVVLPLALFAAGTIAAVFGEGGWRDLKRLRHEQVERQAALAVQQARLDALREVVARLRHDALPRERIAREDLGMLRPGEISFLLPKEEDDARTSSPPAEAPAVEPQEQP